MFCKSIYLLIVLLQTSFVFADVSRDSIPITLPYTSKPIHVDGTLKDWEKYFEYDFQDTMTFLHQAGNHELMTFYEEIYDYQN